MVDFKIWHGFLFSISFVDDVGWMICTNLDDAKILIIMFY